MDATARLQLLGTPTLTRGQASWVLQRERRTQLLVLLALDGGWVGRRDAAALLWPDAASAAAATQLRKTLFRLAELPWGDCIQVQGGALRFDGHSDLAAFEQALRDDRLADALALWQGEPLAGFDDDASQPWTERLRHERERLRAAWRTAALAWLDRSPGDAAAVALSARLLDADPWDEAALQRQLQALQRSGQAAAARKAHDRFVTRVRSELGVAPNLALAAWAEPVSGPAAPPPEPRPADPGLELDAGFVGRGAELRSLAGEFERDEVRLLCLHGTGGAGKTRLARRLMHELAAGFRNGVLYVPLEDLEPGARLGDALLRSLELRAEGAVDPLDAACSALQHEHRLIVFDNFETLMQEARSLSALLQRCPGVKLLVTSRVRLQLAEEWVVELGGLPCPDDDDADHLEAFDAVRLFVQVARRVRPDFQAGAEADALVEICRLVDGLPLALVLAAPWVRVLGCREIVQELRRSPQLLRDSGAAPSARHAGIETVFDQSWRRLSTVEREALARLSAFRGGFTALTARHVAGTPLPVVAALVDHSLLQRDGERLRLHPLVWQLVRERADPALLAASADAHASHFLHELARLRRPAANGAREALRAIELDHENHLAAWQHGAAVDASPSLARGLADAAWALMAHADLRGLRQQGLTLVRRALASAAAVGQPSLKATLLAACAHLEHRLDRDAAAVDTAHDALALAVAPEDLEARLMALKVLGMATMRLGRLDESHDHHLQALAQVNEARDPDQEPILLGNLALVERRRGRLDAAMALLARAAAEHRRLGDAAREARVLNNLAVLLIDRRDFERAQRQLQVALERCRDHGLDGTLAMVLGNLCFCALELGDLALCTKQGLHALEVAERIGDRNAACSVQMSLAMAGIAGGDLAEATARLGLAAQQALAVQVPALQLLCAVVLARFQAATGETQAALATLAWVDAHPAAQAVVRQEVDRFREALREAHPQAQAGAWQGPELEILVNRLVDEAAQSFEPLRRLLRSSTP